MKELAAAAAVVVQRPEFGVDRHHVFSLLSVELGQVLGTCTATEDEKDIASEHLTLADDARHPPAGWRDLEIEVRPDAAVLPDIVARIGNFFEAALARDGDETIGP